MASPERLERAECIWIPLGWSALASRSRWAHSVLPDQLSFRSGQSATEECQIRCSRKPSEFSCDPFRFCNEIR